MPPSKKTSAKLIGKPWNLRDIWNDTLIKPERRILQARNYSYASELGKALPDRYLKMYGVKPTNPPNERSLRKFQAGDVWEWVVGIILISSGMLKKKQIKVDTKLPRLIPVHGRLDFVVGQPSDYNVAKDNIKRMQDQLLLMDIETPPFFFKAIDNFIDKYKGQNLADYITELKTVSSFMMEKLQKTGEPMYHHALQNFHYVTGNIEEIRQGKLLYICKDDCIMEEFDILETEELFQMYRDDIKAMTRAYTNGFDAKNVTKLMPPREEQVLFEDSLFRFSKNWNVEYSDYLTLLYEYKTPEEYRNKWQYKINQWNRVFKRAAMEGQEIPRNGKAPLIIKLTPLNKEVIAEAKKQFPKWDKMVAAAKKAGAFVDNQEEEDEA